MKRTRAAHVGTTAAKRRKHRRRPVPKWLTNLPQLEAIARSRCLMLLSVLSGETPVTDAIERAKISRATYYQLETRALKAMLTAMNPLASNTADGAQDLTAATGRIAQLEAQVQRLEQQKRRTQRLLLLTRKSIRAPIAMRLRTRHPRGRPVRSDAPSARAQNLLSSPTPPGVSLP